MFKFKMSLLLKSMKFRVAMVVLLITATTLGIVLMPKNKAGNQTTTLVAGAYQSGVTVNGITCWKIAGSHPNIYCIQEGQTLNSQDTYYTVGQDMANSSSYFSNFAAATWLVNNMYIPGSDTDEHLSNLANILTSDRVRSQVPISGVTAQDIIALKSVKMGNGQYAYDALNEVNQIVLWNYTNNVYAEVLMEYDKETTFFGNTSLTDAQQRALKYTYYALKFLANEHTVSTYPTDSKYELNKEAVKFNEENYRVGPYTITANGTQNTASVLNQYPIKITVTKKDGSKVEAGKEIVEQQDGAFYLNLEAYRDNITNVEFKIYDIWQSDGMTSSATVYPGVGFQHLMTVDRKEKSTPTTLSDSVAINIEQPEGKYTLILKKVKEDGTTVIESSEATFKINGTESQTAKGILNIAEGKNIEKAEQVDTYEIIETKAPEGFTKFDGTMKVNVHFKRDGKNFVVDKEATTSEGFVNGAELDINNSEITIRVPNKETPPPPPEEPEEPEGKYSVKLYKVDEKGKIVKETATFTINDKDVKTVDGVIDVASNVVVKDEKTEGKYVIVEKDAPDNYYKLDDVITLSVKMIKENNKFVLKDSGVIFTTASARKAEGILTNPNTQRATYKVNGSTVEIYVPNKKIEEQPKKFDLALRKYISKVDGKVVEYTREPEITAQSIIKLNLNGTAEYYHRKNSVAVKVGNEVEYTIRVYNEGEELGYAKEITDYLPEGLSFVGLSEESKKLYTTTSKAGSNVVVIKYNGNTVIKSLRDFIKQATGAGENTKINVTNEYYQEIKIICKVESTENKYITSRAEITNYGYESKDDKGNIIWNEAKEINNVDIDSVQNTIKNELELINWHQKQNVDETGKAGRYYAGAQDDDDFETVRIVKEEVKKEFDLSLRKFITEVNASRVEPSRDPVVDVTKLASGESTTATYTHTKEPVTVKNSDVVTYTIRVYNEGEVDGYATKVMDDIPEGLEFLPSNELNREYKWVMYKEAPAGTTATSENTITYNNKTYVVTENAKDADVIVTSYLAKENGDINLIKAFNPETKKLDYRDLEVTFKVIEPSTSSRVITNYAQVTAHTNANGDSVTDRDSTPNVWIDNDDDQDVEHIILKEFDLSLRKFIVAVNGEKTKESREPQVDVSKLATGEARTATYTHTKDAIDVNTNDVVTYTIRVYNEGGIDGYAAKIMDDIPQGLEFLPDNEINKNYKWVMYKEDSSANENDKNVLVYDGKKYVVTDKASEASFTVTEYLSKENGEQNLIKAFNAETKKLEYKDVQIAFKVVEPSTSSRVITNHAQITKHTNYKGMIVIDRDSTPNQWNKGDDDQDIDNVKVRFFDLALRKWVTKAIIYENGYQKVTETKHGPWDDPEPIVKVDLKDKNLNNIEVKFEYTIRVFNQGEVAGYAKEVSDYIPAGLKFVKADNPDWKEVDGKIVTRALENTLLKKDEYADVKVVLTWVNGANNLGTKTNVAEISEDYNEFGTHDIDSTPNNKVKGEDDIDDAPVILTIKTGSPIVYTGVAIAFISIISLGVVAIRKKVL